MKERQYLWVFNWDYRALRDGDHEVSADRIFYGTRSDLIKEGATIEDWVKFKEVGKV